VVSEIRNKTSSSTERLSSSHRHKASHSFRFNKSIFPAKPVYKIERGKGTTPISRLPFAIVAFIVQIIHYFGGGVPNLQLQSCEVLLSVRTSLDLGHIDVRIVRLHPH
jgi:hypothetical protein